MNEIEYKAKVGAPFKYMPEKLVIKVNEYKEWAQNQTFEKRMLNPKTGEQTSVYLKCPLTIQQFCLYIGVSYKTFKYYFNAEFDNELNETSIKINNELRTIFAHVHEYIQQNQISGAILNEYNGNIVSRINGLTETVHVDTNVTLNSLPLHIGNQVIDLTSADYTVINNNVNNNNLQLTEKM